MSQMCPNCSQDNPDYAPACSSCGEPLRGLLGQNTLLEGRYRLTRVLGCGGMGAVYLASDDRIAGRQVAVKENLNTIPQAQAQFQSEVSLMVGLNHPGLPRVSDQFAGPTGRQYMVMDYVPGETLEEVVGRRGPLSEVEVVGLAGRLLDILEYLHSHSVIHRDVKPGNIKLTPEGKPVLVDFGIAKQHAPGRHTQTAVRGVGSPGFAPLEQYGTGTDARSDLYSLGAVLYYLVTGQAPPVAPDLAAGKSLTPPCQLRPDLSPHLQGVIFKAMALDPAQRYQSAAEMRLALSTPTGPVTGTSPGMSSRPSITTVGMVVGIVAVIGLGIAGLVLVIALSNLSRSMPTPVRPAVSSPTIAPEAYSDSVATPEIASTATPTSVPSVRPTPTGTPVPPKPSRPEGFVAYTAGPEGAWQIFTANPATGETWPLPGQLPNSGVPTWSPVGDLLAFRSNKTGVWQIYTINTDGTGLRQITDDASNNSEAAWSPDGSRFAFVSDRDGKKEIYAMDADGGNQHRLTVNPGWDDDPNWSPDGRWLIFESKREGRMDVYKMQIDGSNLIRLTYGGDSNTTPAWSPDGRLIAFEHKDGSTYHIWIMEGDGSHQRQLTFDGKQNLRPAWSPDGSEIAYTSDRGGITAIWIVPLDGSNTPRRLSPGEGFDAAWSRR